MVRIFPRPLRIPQFFAKLLCFHKHLARRTDLSAGQLSPHRKSLQHRRPGVSQWSAWQILSVLSTVVRTSNTEGTEFLSDLCVNVLPVTEDTEKLPCFADERPTLHFPDFLSETSESRSSEKGLSAGSGRSGKKPQRPAETGLIG